ncbi:MAG: enoyl-CoA hydratase-related protein, partial [Desulfocucumaceae bacterium]
MLLAVAYCGGCNPDIDREELVGRLARDTGWTVKSRRDAGQSADLLLLVNGCPRGCLDPGPAPQWKTLVVAGL